MLFLKDTLKNIKYEEVEVFEDEIDFFEEEFVEYIEEDYIKENKPQLKLVEKTSQSKYEYVYKEENLERPQLVVVSGYSKNRKK